MILMEKSWQKLKASIREITRKTSPISFDERVSKLKELQTGWINYFQLGSIASKLKILDAWIPNRLTYCIWADWKKPERKRKNLIRLGIEQGKAYSYSRTRMGGWALAQSPILGTTITVARLAKRGYESMGEYYQKVSPIFNEPLYTRTVCTVV